MPHLTEPASASAVECLPAAKPRHAAADVAAAAGKDCCGAAPATAGTAAAAACCVHQQPLLLLLPRCPAYRQGLWHPRRYCNMPASQLVLPLLLLLLGAPE
jgi:hypothetical protein